MSEKTSPQMDPNVKEAREHFKSARQSMRQSVEQLFPKEFVASRRAARKEFLLGLRKLLDAAIEHTEKKE